MTFWIMIALGIAAIVAVLVFIRQEIRAYRSLASPLSAQGGMTYS